MKRKVLKNIDNEEDDILYIVISKIMYSVFGSNSSYSASYCSNKMEYINFNLTAEACLMGNSTGEMEIDYIVNFVNVSTPKRRDCSRDRGRNKNIDYGDQRDYIERKEI